MTKEEIKEFLKKVKGKRIRFTGWGSLGLTKTKTKYFIPNGKYSSDFFYGKNQGCKDLGYGLNRGFKKNELGYRWEFFESNSTNFIKKL